MLRTLARSRERILVYGEAGSGKSTAYLNIASLSQETGSPAHFYVFDSDQAMDRMLDTAYPNLSNIEVTSGRRWEDLIAFTKHVREVAKPDDWVIFDFYSSAWEWVQAYYVEQVFGQSKIDYFLKMRKELASEKNIKMLDGWKDWVYIKALYQDWTAQVIYDMKCHIFAVTKAEPVRDEDPATLQSMFGFLSVKPQGEKSTAHLFHTLLNMKKTRHDYIINTVKDRGRKELTGESITNFAISYLVIHGGWEM